MANDALVEYKIYGKGAKKLNNCLNKLQEEGKMYPNLRDIIEYFHCDTTGLYLRGSLVNYTYEPSIKELLLEYDSAWDEMPDFRAWIKDFILREDEDDTVLYSVEEPGNNIFYSNDPNHSKYLVNNYNSGDCDYVQDDDELIKYLQKYLNSKSKDLKTLYDELEKRNISVDPDDKLYINEFDIRYD